MTTSNLPKDLYGKKITVCYATVDIDIKFGLWKNYSSWVSQDQQPEYWYEPDVLKNYNVAVEIDLGNKNIAKEVFDDFKAVRIHYMFEDDIESECNLTIKIVNLNNLPIQDNTGIFIAGMIEIQSLKLQGIEIKHLLENTLLGNDIILTLPITMPVYNWMINQRKHILPEFF